MFRCDVFLFHYSGLMMTLVAVFLIILLIRSSAIVDVDVTVV